MVVNASVNTSSATGIPKEPTWDPSVHLGSRQGWKPNPVKGLQCCVVTYLDGCAPEKKGLEMYIEYQGEKLLLIRIVQDVFQKTLFFFTGCAE